ncbi:hypothetical protein M2163_001388 [Streptomyces sp. SAI-135]|nr:hypothetical protein [Streptomyces sp. SAI-090]MDH6553913.1 hypothetical protein [Streptomyces sp. SAI-041]MDH6572991.1 hypothetical protein [Streptomyces sp. SAI-117]MDH6582047.1 hypothetical protein [Streptomyces sp. SAI-133]MDH6614280.1 hypothetical protein [Streptomyces sp. SAI-135]
MRVNCRLLGDVWFVGSGKEPRSGPRDSGDSMRYVNKVRGSVLTVVVASTALAVAACQPGAGGADTADGGTTSSGTVSSAPSSFTPGSPAPSGSLPAPTTSAPLPSAPAPAGSAATCAAGSLKATARQAAVRPSGTGTGAAVVEFTNVSARTCVLKGHPAVAGAGNGSPEMNVPLTVKPTGAAGSVKVAPGGRAWVKLTFVQVQGEGDGYCASGSAPVVYPTMVVRLPGSGAHQVALDDGQFAECDDTVTVTAVSAVRPS